MKVSENAPHFEKQIVNQISDIRIKLEKSQAEMGKLIGTNQQFVSRFEKNDHSPTLQTVLTMLDVLGYKLEIVAK